MTGSAPPSVPGGRLLGASQVAIGLPLAVWPARVAAALAGPHGRPAPAAVVRVLGVRSLVQGVITLCRPSTTVLLVGAAVDATHAASMAPLLALSPAHRRAAGVSAAAALLSAVGAAGLTRRRGGAR